MRNTSQIAGKRLSKRIIDHDLLSDAMDGSLKLFAETGDIRHLDGIAEEPRELLTQRAISMLRKRKGDRAAQKRILNHYGFDDYGETLCHHETDVKSALSREAELSVALTGATSGDLLVGVRNVNRGAILKIDGDIFPSRKVLDELRNHGSLWKDFLSRLQVVKHLSKKDPEAREKWLDEQEDSIPDGCLTDAGAKLMVIQPGGMTQNVVAERLDEMMCSGYMNQRNFESYFPVKGHGGGWKGRHTLVLFRKYWRVVPRHDVVSSYEGRKISLTTQVNSYYVLPNICSAYTKKGRDSVRHVGLGDVPNNSHLPLNRWTRSGTKDLAVGFDNGGRPFVMDDKLAQKMKGLTPGACKSLIQKIIRFRPKYVAFPSFLPGNSKISSEVCLSQLIRHLVAIPGSFVPDIQRYVTGAEAAFKRTVVSILEDANAPLERIEASLSGALLAQRLQGWKPKEESVQDLCDVAIQALESNAYWDYNFARGARMDPCIAGLADDPGKNTSALLDEIKSFKSDLDFVRDIARGCGVVNGYTFRPETMMMERCVDQHWAPDFVYFMDPSYVNSLCEEKNGKVFGDLFSATWQYSSSINPRKKEFEIESNSFVRELRRAQRLYLVARQHPVATRVRIPNKEYKVHLDLPSGWLSCLIGPLSVRNKVVTLGADDPLDLIVIRKPSRSNPNASPIGEAEIASAKLEATRILQSGVLLKAARAPIPELHGSKAYLTDDGFMVQTQEGMVSWDTIRMNVKLEYPLLEAPTEPLEEASLIEWGYGVTSGADLLLDEEIQAIEVPVLRRVLRFLSGYSCRVEMNSVGRDGAGTVHSVTRDDVAAYQSILRISSLYPAALMPRKAKPCSFDVKSPPLLWHVRSKLRASLDTMVKEPSRWKDVEDKSRAPQAHQLDALELIKQNLLAGNPGTFLWMTVGAGKTMILLLYVQWLIRTGRMPKYFVYTLPSSALESVSKEIQLFGLQPRLMVPLKSACGRSYPEGVEVSQGKDVEPLPFRVNLVTVDTHLRLCGRTLEKFAPDALFVFDEVHKNLNDSQRTSSALSLASLSRDFVAFTGTPVVDSKAYKLIAWLQKIVPFEVNQKNYLVAANAMISKQVNTRVKVLRSSIVASMDDLEKHRYESLVPPSLGGRNKNPVYIDWRTATDVCYEVVTREMSRLAMKLNRGEGRRVCLVCRDFTHQGVLYKHLLKLGAKPDEVLLLQRDKGVHLTPSDAASPYKFAICPISRPEGYTLTLMDVMISSVYPSNLATRTQIEGRINRLSQCSESVHYYTVHTGILTRIMESHKEAKCLMKALEEVSRTV